MYLLILRDDFIIFWGPHPTSAPGYSEGREKGVPFSWFYFMFRSLSRKHNYCKCGFVLDPLSQPLCRVFSYKSSPWHLLLGFLHLTPLAPLARSFLVGSLCCGRLSPLQPDIVWLRVVSRQNVYVVHEFRVQLPFFNRPRGAQDAYVSFHRWQGCVLD